MKVPPAASAIKEMRMKPESIYETGLVVRDHGGRRCPAGRLLPQSTVCVARTQRAPVDDLLGPGFALVRLHRDPSEAFASCKADIWRKLSPRRICLVPTAADTQKTADGVISAWDGEGQIAHFLHGRHHHLALIRPDRHVLGTFPETKEPAFAAALQDRFST